ncbi:MAG: hypothetical protein OEZ01_08800 [Candidatus Heimdallarchaeota archaeon]|nr:hypothetical protein [Candidatus Heimdallarchaeota archaeon]MDH5646092.1 hypothetical protein [Candidatus Heimdallarchaeota archaeon]
MSNDGITVYHNHFDTHTVIDEYLFSSFSSAIIAFSKELEDNLYSIRMQRQELYFREHKNLIFVISVDKGYGRRKIRKIISKLRNSENLKSIIEASKLNVELDISVSFDKELRELFGLPPLDNSKLIPKDVEKEKNVVEEKLLEVLKELDDLSI